MSHEKDNDESIKLNSILDVSRILLFSEKMEKTDLLNKMIDTFAESEEDIARDDLAWGIFHREGLLCTGIGNGIATPHFRLDTFDKTVLGISVCPAGITAYESLDGQPVSLVFMIVTGKGQRTEHIQVMKAVGKLFFDGRIKAAFLAATTPEKCLEILSRAEQD